MNPDKQDTSSSLENYTTHDVDANIRPVNDEEPFAEVQLTAHTIMLASEQQHTEQSEPSYDTYLIGIDQGFLSNKSSAVHEKPHTPRSCLRWKPMGRIFKTIWMVRKRNIPGTLTTIRLDEQILIASITVTDWKALELGKSISLTEAKEEVVAREVHATHARIMSESEPEPIQRRQFGIAFRDSFIVSKKRSSDSSMKLKGIQTLTPAKQEAVDIMKALKESKKISKRQPRTGVSNEGTSNILGVPDESTIVSRVSSEGTGFKPGVPNKEKLILEWEADVDSEHFDKDDNAGDDK
ncbi:hypothetical protein Tco_0002683 [Tanacetum coccineum]